MIGETLDLMAAFARHATHGVNAIAQDLPRYRYGGIIQKAAPPSDLPIISTVEEPLATTEHGPSDTPCGLLWADNGGGVGEGRASETRDVALLFAYVTAADADPDASAAIAETVIRSAMITFRRFNAQSLSNGYRALNGVTLMGIDERRLIQHDVVIPVGRVKYWKLLELHVSAIDSLVGPRARGATLSAAMAGFSSL